MTPVVFIIVPFLGLAAYLMHLKNKSKRKVIKNYYFRRFLRNKLQIERYISEIKKIKATHECGGDYFTEGITMDAYLADLESEYKRSYSDFNIKTLRKSNLNDKHKKFYSKMLMKQGEKLYFVENDLNIMNKKYSA